jgi:uncharacterized protein (TIGR03086 family)
MNAKELFTRCLDQATKVVSQLKSADYSLPTPDTEWDARTLANHMLYELSWIPDMLSGQTIAKVGSKYDGDLIGDDPAESWEEAAAIAKGEVILANMRATAHLSYGNTTNEDYLRQVSGDLLIHAWDLAAALGLDRTLDAAATQEVYKGILPSAPSLSKSGLYKPSLVVAPDSDTQTQLLALVGRDANWQPS